MHTPASGFDLVTLCISPSKHHTDINIYPAASHSPKGLTGRIKDGAEGVQHIHKKAANRVSLSCHEHCRFMPL